MIQRIRNKAIKENLCRKRLNYSSSSLGLSSKYISHKTRIHHQRRNHEIRFQSIVDRYVLTFQNFICNICFIWTANVTGTRCFAIKCKLFTIFAINGTISWKTNVIYIYYTYKYFFFLQISICFYSNNSPSMSNPTYLVYYVWGRLRDHFIYEILREMR